MGHHVEEWETAEQTDLLPLSFNQELLCAFDSGDTSGPFGPRYHIIIGRRLRGPLDVPTLHAALSDVVRRHEPLRTNVIRAGGQRHQRVYPPCRPRLDVRERPGLSTDERDRCAADLLDELETELMGADELPHLRAVLLRFDDRDAVLALMTHHLSTDGWSMGLIVRDLVACYAARRNGTPADLPPLTPYRRFVAWERERARSPEAARAREYWKPVLAGARYSALPTDHPRSENLPHVTADYRFDLEQALLEDVKRAARAARCSSFMVLFAAYYLFVQQLTGESDLVVSTHTLGRPPGLFDDTVGSFFNFLPVRVNLTGYRDGRELLHRVRTACIGAYQHELPAVEIFQLAPDLMASAMADQLAPVTFQAFPAAAAPRDRVAGDLTFSAVFRPALSLPVTSDIPDGALWSIWFEPTENGGGSVTYCTNRFDPKTVLRMTEEYQDILRRLLADPSLRSARG